MMDDFEWEQLDRYLAGDCTPAEREAFEAKVATRPDYAIFVSACRKALEAADERLSPSEQQAMWSAIVGRIVAEAPPRVEPAAPRRVRWKTAGRLAAGAMLVAGVVLAGRWVLRGREVVPPPGAPDRVVTAPRGQRVQLKLSDGTDVMLGAGSTLRLSRSFATAEREVSLEGEAYFAVAHDQRPFVVRAGGLVARDLGTEFVVRAFPGEAQPQVVVRSGMVAVRPIDVQDTAKESRVVRPGELGRLGADGKAVVTRADTAVAFAWTNGTLIFDGTPLREALPQLSRWYDLDFRLADASLGSIPLSGTLDQTLTPDRLDLLAASMGLRQVRSGKTVTFHRMEGGKR